jgi:hypothetical protein
MAEMYDIDYVRAIIQHELNDDTIFLTSFYEQIGNQDALERYAKKIEELIYDLNKQSYKARGVITQSGSADIVNIVNNYICPLEYGVRLDVAYDKQLEEDSTDEDSDIEYVNEKVNQLLLKIKGRKFDVVQGEDGDLYVCKTPTINYATGQLELNNDVYMVYTGANDITSSGDLYTIANELCGTGKVWIKPATQVEETIAYNVYIESDGVLYQAVFTISFSGGSYYLYLSNVVAIEDTFSKYKVSLSANNIQRDMPYDFNGTGRMAIFFNGQATICDENVMLGNDIIKTRIAGYVVEPLEIPSGSKLSDTGNQIVSSTYPLPTTYNASVENTLSYAFNVIRNNDLIMALYKLARKQSIASPLTSIDMTFTIEEYDYQFGILTKDTIKCKLDDLSIMNTNGDILTIKVVFKLGSY